MNSVPSELYQLPRVGGSPPNRKPRPPRKPKDPKLDTISERERPANDAQKSTSPMYRKDMSTSTSDLTGHGKDDGESTEGVKKVVQKAQITALAKMLSALRR